jgi:hypothetical protein
MPSLNYNVRRMMSKGKQSKRPSSDNVSAASTANSHRPSLDSTGSIYSRTSSAYNSPRPSGSFEQVSQRPHEYWSDGVEQNPYTNLHDDINVNAVMDTDLYQPPTASSAPPTDSIRTTRRSVQPPAAFAHERTSLLASPFRKPDAIIATPDGGLHGYGGKSLPSALLTTMPDAVFEDEEEENIRETKREMRRLKVLDVASTSNALRLAHQAFEVGSNTLKTLQEQGDRIQNAEDNFGRAASGNEAAARKLKELKQADRMVSIHNPFTATKNERSADAEMIALRRHDREQRDAVRAARWHAWKTGQIHRLPNVPRHRGATSQDVLARAKYQFEEDSDDERIEDIIEGNVDELMIMAQKMKGVAMATNVELHQQNEVLDRTRRLADRVDDGLAMNQARLDRFR